MIERGPIQLVSQECGLTWKFQGGELVDVYKHGRAVIHSERLQFADDLDPVLVADIKKGLCRVQGQHKGGKVVVSLPEDGASHYDLTSALLRALWFGGAGDEPKVAQGSTFGNSAYSPPQGGTWYPTPEY